MHGKLIALAMALGLGLSSSGIAQETQNPAKKGAQPQAPKKVEPAKEPAKKDEPKKDDKAGADMEAAWAKAAEVGPNHELLKAFEGEWSVVTTEFKPDGSEGGTDKGTMASKLVMGGRFLSMDYDGRYHGRFFKGGGLWGYSNVDKRFEMTWADSASTSITYLTGTADQAKKVFTMTGDYTDPASGKKSKQKEITTITSKDSYKSDFYMDLGGKELKVMSIAYTRAGAAEKPDKGGDKNPDKKDDKPGKAK